MSSWRHPRCDVRITGPGSTDPHVAAANSRRRASRSKRSCRRHEMPTTRTQLFATSAVLNFSANALSRFPWSAFAIAISITHVLAPPPGPLTQGWALAGGNPASWA